MVSLRRVLGVASVALGVAGLAHAQVVPGPLPAAPLGPIAPAGPIALPAGVPPPRIVKGPTNPVSMAVVTPAPANPLVLPPCPLPDLAKCQEAGYLGSYCGRALHAAHCRGLIRAAIPAAMADPRLVREPTSRAIIGTRRVRAEPLSFTDFNVAGMSTLAVGTQQRTRLSARKTLSILAKGLWHANGIEVTSCGEYAHEKFWDYSVFEDLSAGSEDPRAFFTAYQRDLAPKATLRSKDGRQIFAIDWPRNQPKNRFFQPVPLWYPSNTYALQFQWAPNVRSWATGQAVTPIPDFAWHQRMSAALANVHDEELDAMQVRQREFDELVARRATIVSEYPDKARRVPINSPASVKRLEDNTAIELAAIDQLLQNAIIQAKVDGCLEAGTTKCDWAPSLFEDVLESQMVARRQAAYKDCMSIVGTEWGQAAPIQNTPVPAPTSCRSCIQGTAQVDGFISHVRTSIKALRPVTTAAGPFVGRKTSDDSSIGNSKFNAGFEYSAGWDAKNFIRTSESPCNANVHGWANFSAFVTLFGKRGDVLDAKADVASSATDVTGSASMRILGRDLFTPLRQQRAASFDIVDGPRWGADFSYAQHFVVIAVPIKVEAGLVGTTGVDISISSGGLARTCATKEGNLQVRADVRVVPFARLDAFLSASVDLLVAEAGVRGELTLLEAALPFRSTVEVKPAGARLWLYADSHTALELSTLGGRVFLFVEYPPDEEARKNLFRWKGVSSKTPLFDLDLASAPLAELQIP